MVVVVEIICLGCAEIEADENGLEWPRPLCSLRKVDLDGDGPANGFFTWW